MASQMPRVPHTKGITTKLGTSSTTPRIKAKTVAGSILSTLWK